MAERPLIQIISGPLAGKRYEVAEGGLRLGRSSSNDICITDGKLSRNHLLFETAGESGIRVTDLASANGTLVNGRMLGSEPATLRIGDEIEAGDTLLRVVDRFGRPAAAPVAEQVDLGLGAPAPGAGGAANGEAPQGRKRILANLLWAVAILACVSAACVVMTVPLEKKPAAAPLAAAQADENPPLREMVYEKVEANSEGIFRYELAFTETGLLRVAVDDLPKERRHVAKEKKLSANAIRELGDILRYKTLREIDEETIGATGEPPALNALTLTVVYANRVRRVRVVNEAESEALKGVRERLETFSKNELGVWALQYSSEKLIERAKGSTVLGDSKWAEREVNHGNLFEAVAAYREALFYLDTVNPKPDCAAKAKAGLERAKKELDKRYRDQRFLANRAINLRQWEDARRELHILMEMIPDRNDDRNREAKAKLVDVEKRLKKGELQ